MTTRTFPLRTILTVTTSRLLTMPRPTDRHGMRDNGIGDLYELLSWLTDDSVWTQQIPRFMDECRPWLLRWFPELEKADAILPDLDRAIGEAGGDREAVERAVAGWLTRVEAAGCRPSYDVLRIPADDHERKHPYDELVAMMGTDEGIVIIQPDPDRAGAGGDER